MNQEDLLIEIARDYVGVKEDGSSDDQDQVHLFRQAVTGNDIGQAWCLDFVQYCVKKVDDELGTESQLPELESTVQTWNRCHPAMKSNKPMPGSMVIWEHYHKGVATGLGHCGIVVEVIGSETLMTVEGNTTDSAHIDRMGDGVYLKIRHQHPDPNGEMRLLGYVRPWAKPRMPGSPGSEAPSSTFH